MRVSYHTHSDFCDGNGKLEDYIKKAIYYGFGAIGLSSHAPIPFDPFWTMNSEDLPLYLKTAYDLKDKYKNKIQVYVGLEIDYIKGSHVKICDNIDYYISSVHYNYCKKGNRYTTVDGPYDDIIDTIENCYDGDSSQYTKDYYTAVKDMIVNRKPDIVGHLDLIKKSNKDNILFDENEKWYKNEIRKVLKAAKEQGCIIEINTGGMSRNYVDTSYPSPWIIKIMKDMDIPVMLNSDAHKPKWLNTGYDMLEKILKDIGYKKQRVFLDGSFKDVDIGL